MKRIGKRGEGKFKRISWDEAIQEITSETMRLKKTYGPGSRHVIYGTGVSAVMNPVGLMRRLLYLDGGELGAYNSYSSACTEYVTPYIYGDGSAGNSSDDVLNSKLLILWGHNPAETLFGAFRNHYLSLAKAKGLRIIVVDPRQSDTAITYAQEWVPIRPGTDSAMADAMAYVIWNEGLQDQQFMDKFCVGFDELHMPEGLPFGESYHSYLFGIKDGIHKTPMWAEEITGVPADTIERIAREYAVTKPACIMPGLGLQRTANGEQSIRSMAMLSCLTGNVGISGGGTGANDWFDLHEPVTMPMPENPYPGKIPSFLWSKAVSSGTEMKTVRDGIKGVEKLDSNLKLIYCMASNTLVNQHSNINETVALLQDTSKCEFILCSDIFMTPSAKFADILLPATSLFEGENIANPWMDINYVLYVNQAIQPIFETRFEYDWIKEVARQMGLYEEYTEGHETVREWLETSYVIARKHNPELVEFEVFRENGCYQYQDNKTTIAYRENIEQGKPFKTPSGKIEIFSKTLYDMNNPEEIPGLPRYTPCVEGPEDTLTQKYPLQLIGYHTKSRTHSIHDKNELLEELYPPALWLHPDDAAARGIRSGQDVLVFNDRGQVRIPVRITTRIMRGVVAMSQGGWYTPDKDGTDTRGSINVLTMTHKPTPLAKGNPQHTNLVEVKLYID